MSYLSSLAALNNFDLSQAKTLARKEIEPSRSLAVAFNQFQGLVTFDNPKNPNARWGKVVAVHNDFNIRVAYIGTGNPFEIQGLKERAYTTDAQAWEYYVGDITPSEFIADFVLHFNPYESAVDDFLKHWDTYELDGRKFKDEPIPSWLKQSLIDHIELCLDVD